MKGLKIKQPWIGLILNGEKTMEVRSQKHDFLNQTIALGNSDTKQVEGYAYCYEIVEIPMRKLDEFEKEHRATEELRKFYKNKNSVYGFRLKKIIAESNPYPYPKNASNRFNVERNVRDSE
jgi:hypothetical protein